MSTVEWYYARNNKQSGPVADAELKQMAERGELRPDDLIWRQGMKDWLPAGKLKGLFEARPPEAGQGPAPGAALPAEPAAPIAPQRSPRRRRSLKHAFDGLLEAARGWFDPVFVRSAVQVFAWGGYYGLYAAEAALLALSVLLAVKGGGAALVFLGLVLVLALLVLQYAAGRFLAALERLDETTSGRLSSAAFLDSWALVCSASGLVAMVALAVVAVEVGLFSLAIPGVVLFIVGQFVALVALHPDSLKITIDPDTPPGEEAIGLVLFLLKLGVRLTPVVFGVGVAWGTLGLIYAAGLAFAPAGDEAAMRTGAIEGPAAMVAMEGALAAMRARFAAFEATIIVLVAAVVPFLYYVKFLLLGLALDVVRSVVQLPQSLERMTAADQAEE